MPEATFDRVTLLGRLTRDPEIRSLEAGDQVATFSVATTDTWKNRDGEPQERS
jgi:single-strand DNA-binding protein